MEQNTKTNITNIDTWIKLLYMILFGLLLAVARMVIWVVAILQFLMVLIAGQDNNNLRNLGQGVAKWSLQALLYLTFNSDEKPFPFSDWPEIDEKAQPEIIVATETAGKADDIPTFTAATSVEKPVEGKIVDVDETAESSDKTNGANTEADNDADGGDNSSDKR